MTQNRVFITVTLALVSIILISGCLKRQKSDADENKIRQILLQMSLDEKIGQLQLVHSPGGDQSYELIPQIEEGLTGAVLNEARPEMIRKLQQAAVENSRLGIPLLFGRDVIHGFKTIFPVNIGLAATFNPELVQAGAAVAAIEASSTGINWNFAPMVDIARDPRWGRMAESFGEDPHLVTAMGLAMLKGFRGDDPDKPRMAACAKHFAAYGAAEGGRDYNTASVPEVELWNTYFMPFMALKDAGVSTFMAGFNELNGIPASGNAYLFRDILKGQWNFQGFAVSDWASVSEMRIHGYAADEKEAAAKAMLAGIDMEMAGTTYMDHLPELIREGVISEKLIDDAVRRILQVKFDLGLFNNPYADPEGIISSPPAAHLEIARKTASQSLVLLKNDKQVLPLNKDIGKIAVIGPMANDRYEQLGTWIFDGDTNLTVTPLKALQEMLGHDRLVFVKGLATTRSHDTKDIAAAVTATKNADVAVIFAGEESIITGEAHSRAYLNLPGAQDDLIRAVASTGKPVILVVMTPRPLTIGEISAHADAVLYAWHPGTMGGPAIADVLLGHLSPSGKLPVTFPKAPGQIPIYYAHKNTGRPASERSFVPIEDIPVRSFQTSIGNTSHYLDIGYAPLYPFGFGLSYTTFKYGNIKLSTDQFKWDEEIRISVELANTGVYDADEVVQLYVRDLTASITRPVKELKAFKRIGLKAGESKEVEFTLTANDLGFYDNNGNYIIETGSFQVWVGGSSNAQLTSYFTLSN